MLLPVRLFLLLLRLLEACGTEVEVANQRKGIRADTDELRYLLLCQWCMDGNLTKRITCQVYTLRLQPLRCSQHLDQCFQAALDSGSSDQRVLEAPFETQRLCACKRSNQEHRT